MKTKLVSKPPTKRGIIVFRAVFPRSSLRLTPTPFGMLVTLEGCTLAGETGGPSLPMRVIRVALPSFTRATGVEVKPKKVFRLTRKPVLLLPLQPLRPGVLNEAKSDRQLLRIAKRLGIKPSTLRPPEKPVVEPVPGPSFVQPRGRLYRQAIERPRPIARLLKVEQFGLTPVAAIEVNPVRYNRSALLEFYPEIEIVVKYESVRAARLAVEAPARKKVGEWAKPIRSRAQARWWVDAARLAVINPDWVTDRSDLFAVPYFPVDYLIITDNRKWNAAKFTVSQSVGDLVSVFQKLASWKSQRGLATRVVTVTDIVNGEYGNFTTGARDLQEVIRNFLKWAYDYWGISWVLLGGDTEIIPVRRVAGRPDLAARPDFDGAIQLQTTDDPPPDNKSFWDTAGNFLKMKVANPDWCVNLVRPDTGLLIPYDPTGSSVLGWYYTTDKTYATRSATKTKFVRVNGPKTDIQSNLMWFYESNMIPTDLYYASLVAPTYNQPGKHDWDLLDNETYGQYDADHDFDGVKYQADVSVGRAPVSSVVEANAFVDKVIAYEQFRSAPFPDGTLLPTEWPQRLVLVSSNWEGRMCIEQAPLHHKRGGGNWYHHTNGNNYSVIELKNDVKQDFEWLLLAKVTETDLRLIPYDMAAASVGRGWYYAKGHNDLDPSKVDIGFSILDKHWSFSIPIPTQWIVVYGPADELTPSCYILDRTETDLSMTDQEELRKQLKADFPAITPVARLYEDEIDLPPADIAAAPLEHLTSDRLRDAINSGPHFLSLSGHGGWSDGCCYLNKDMARNAANGFQTFIAFADSCWTNAFEVEEAMSEDLLNNPNGGAVAYVGNTRYSWIGAGDDLQRKFFKQLKTTPHLGLLNDSRWSLIGDQLPTNPDGRCCAKWAVFSQNLLGDPEMPVWIGKSQEFKVDFTPTAERNVPFEVRVGRLKWIPGPHGHVEPHWKPIPDAAVHIQQDNFTRLKYTDHSGKATFDLKAAQPGDLHITVTKVGYIPYLDTAEIVP